MADLNRLHTLARLDTHEARLGLGSQVCHGRGLLCPGVPHHCVRHPGGGVVLCFSSHSPSLSKYQTTPPPSPLHHDLPLPRVQVHTVGPPSQHYLGDRGSTPGAHCTSCLCSVLVGVPSKVLSTYWSPVSPRIDVWQTSGTLGKEQTQ